MEGLFHRVIAAFTLKLCDPNYFKIFEKIDIILVALTLLR